MIRIALIAMALTVPMLQAEAIPAKRVPFTVTNSDGTQLTIMLCGDENYHFYATPDGVPVVQEENGDYRLAPELVDSISTSWTASSRKRTASRAKRTAKIKARRAFGYPSSYQGEKKGIVILVNFKDLSMKSTSTQATFSRMFNEEGYAENNHIGSVHDYFYDQSYGTFNLTFDVLGPVTVSRNYSYYGQNDKDGMDTYPATMVAEACRLANTQYDIDWSDYDWDGDGEVDQVFVVYAGYGENAGAPASTLWPHEFDLASAQYYYHDGSGSILLDGCWINTYAISCELAGTRGSTLCGIGTACHEFSHCLGFPDFYDTTYSGGFGMDAYSLMSSGSFNGANYNGECPAGFSAYERWFAGWLDFKELSRPTTITDMPCLGDTAVAYIIYNDGNRNEYFTLENRQSERWYKYLGSTTGVHGILVCHVDYDETVWLNNEPNSVPDHQRMSIIPAGKTFGTLKGTEGEMYYNVSAAVYRSQLFPGTKKVTTLDNTSHKTCGGQLFNQNTDGSYYMQKPITDITETNGLISFKFMGGGDTAIAGVPQAEGRAGESIYYRLDGTRIQQPVRPGVYLVRQGETTRKIFIR